MLEKCVIPINYRTYLRLRAETLMVSGVRGNELMQPYSLRVGANSRLDDVFERNYRPKHTRTYLPGIAWKDLAGAIARDATTSQAATVLVRRDPNAPVYITQDDLDSLEQRRDITELGKQFDSIKNDEPKQELMVK
ncbi:uncharacterized protein MAM_00317 [Metarhizium album ARSEF 1941]|uniref:Uncharacterized protein n=1 Tax=Metarhizium album (strain ARSEF 1941) TaxID=1081103 RepID=A0A0B2X7R1_METAS|nr:uncharacterized protein MAM_00317 [Metarhizium album ARSEF 1941]KHO01316.1 hypothetical protein MAM_00317 [Metarhizium album ARSEF 1941]